MLLPAAKSTVPPSTLAVPPVSPALLPEASRVPLLLTAPLLPPSSTMAPLTFCTLRASMTPVLFTTLASRVSLAPAVMITCPPSAWISCLFSARLFSTLWYLTRGEFVLGAATSGVNLLLIALALPVATLDTAQWLGWGIGLFVVGWVIQFVGHKYEGRKPAFVDDLVGLLVGPMFVVAEALFAAGWGKGLLAAIEAKVGPTRSGPAVAQA